MRLRPWRVPALRPEPLARAVVVGDLVRTTLERDGACTWRAWGGSMARAIRDGQTVRLVPADTVAAGDVVMAAIDDDTLVVHRVRRIDGDGTVHLRGDSCWRNDPPVTMDAVIALVEPTPAPSLRARLYDIGALAPLPLGRAS